MTDENLNKQMEDWVEREISAAPELRPTEEMYQLVEAKDQQGQKSWIQSHWATMGVALTIFIALMIGWLILENPAIWFNPKSDHLVALVAQRERPDLQPVPPEKGKGRGSQAFQQITLQIHAAAVGKIEAVDLREDLTKPITLTSQDDFRLLIQPDQPYYVYLFMVNAEDQYQALHPETGFHPLQPENITPLPSPPNWFYIAGENGAYRLLLIAAHNELPELDKRYQQSTSPDLESAQRALNEYIETLKTDKNQRFEVLELTIQLQE